MDFSATSKNQISKIKKKSKGKSEAVGVFECFDGDAEEIIEKAKGEVKV